MVGAGDDGSGADEQQRTQARGRQVDQIVEPCRRPSEGKETVVLVADHAVSGINSLVERAAGKAADHHPQ